MPGRVEAGDLFGASLSVEGSLRGGAPGEDVGSNKDAGSVTFFGNSSYCCRYYPEYAITQDSPRVPDQAEAGNRFGASITGVGDFCRKDAPDGIAIGVPGQNIGPAAEAGAVVLFDTGIFDDEGTYVVPVCSSVWIQQGGRAPGSHEPGDRFGTHVSTSASGDLVIAAPGEDRGHHRIRDAGVIDFVHLPDPKPLNEQTLLGGSKAGVQCGKLWS